MIGRSPVNLNDEFLSKSHTFERRVCFDRCSVTTKASFPDHVVLQEANSQ